MLKGDKYFELIKITKLSEIMLAYRNRNSFSIYPIGLANKDFTLLLIFSFASILFGLGVLLDAFLSRRLYNDAMMVFEI
jgi:hypothetical protein